MPILVAGDGLKKNNEYYEQKIHNLIVNGVEKYRLFKSGKDGNKLVYAKGKINFDLNERYLDSNGQEHFIFSKWYFWDRRKMPESLFAFYKDGFYYKDDKKRSSFNQCESSSLSEMMTTKWIAPDWWRFVTPIKFQGWYFGGWKIDSIDDVYNHTDLFNFKSDTSLPEITLRAKWKIPTYTLTVHNITKYGYNKRIAESSFYNKQEKKTFKGSSSTFRNISYNTDLKEFLKNNISDVKYCTWAYDALDGTKNQQSLRNGPQKFLGWTNKQYVYKGTNVSFECRGPSVFDLASETTPARVDVYPQFETIIIVKKASFKSNTFYYDNQAKKRKVSTAGGKYLLRETVYDGEVKAENSIYIINAGVPLEYFRFTKKKNGEYNKHYRYVWTPPERVDYYSTTLDRDRVPYSSTIVYKIRSVTPYDWQREYGY